jgi:putative lipoic acid-binding regulatory protein
VRNPDDTEHFYNRLKGKLEQDTLWPSQYLYKFIIPADKEKKEAIERIFNHAGAVIKTKKSSGGKYLSLSVWIHLKNPDEVIAYYKKIHAIKGVISL